MTIPRAIKDEIIEALEARLSGYADMDVGLYEAIDFVSKMDVDEED